MNPRAPGIDDYDVKPCAVGDLAEADLDECISLVTGGNAVGPQYAKRDLPRALVVAIARKGGRIVGVGTIKPVRRDYASGIAVKSGVPFSADMPELGYVAVHPDHRGNRLSHRLVEALQSKSGSTLFATTSSDRMKRTLTKAGFVQRGREWNGRRQDQLSLWMRE